MSDHNASQPDIAASGREGFALSQLVKMRCFRCGGSGWFPGAQPRNMPQQPDQPCAQCGTHGFVYSLPPVGSRNIPRVMEGQTVLPLPGVNPDPAPNPDLEVMEP